MRIGHENWTQIFPGVSAVQTRARARVMGYYWAHANQDLLRRPHQAWNKVQMRSDFHKKGKNALQAAWWAFNWSKNPQWPSSNSRSTAEAVGETSGRDSRGEHFRYR